MTSSTLLIDAIGSLSPLQLTLIFLILLISFAIATVLMEIMAEEKK